MANLKDVDREFVCLYLLFDENVSWYLDHNIQTFTSDQKGVKKLEFAPVDNEGNSPASVRDSPSPTPSLPSMAVSTAPDR